MVIRLLMKEGQKVDPGMVFHSVDEGSDEDCLVVSPNQIPINQTDLLAIVKLPGNASFEKRKLWGKKKEEVEDDEWRDPEINFSMSMGSKVHPDTILRRIKLEWRKNGGN